MTTHVDIATMIEQAVAKALDGRVAAKPAKKEPVKGLVLKAAGPAKSGPNVGKRGLTVSVDGGAPRFLFAWELATLMSNPESVKRWLTDNATAIDIKA